MTAKGPSEQYPDRKAIVQHICDGLMRGQGLAVTCREEGMPHFSVIYDWRRDDPELGKMLDEARRIGFDVIAENCIDIADASDEYEPKDTAFGKPVRDPQRDKLRVWTRLQLLAKWDPKRYGEMQKLEHSGSIGIEQLVTQSRKPSAE